MSTRRKFLRGLGGTVVALPFLEGLVWKSATAQPPRSPVRFIHVNQANGTNRADFWPSTSYGPLSASSFDTGCALYPLRSYADRLLVLRGIHTAPGGAHIAGHFHGMAKRLTAAVLAEDANGNNEDAYATGISIDQLIANRLNPGGRGALTLRAGRGRTGAQGAISYRGPVDPVAGESNPWVAYRDMIGLVGGTDGGDEALARLVQRRQSVLDLVSDEMAELERLPLSRADRDKLDMHFTAIRGLEVGMDAAGLIPRELPADTVAELESIDPALVERNASYPDMARLQMEVLALAVASGYTRAATLMMSVSAGNVLYQWDDMDFEYGHHKISHGSTTDGAGGEPLAGYQSMLHRIDLWHARQFRYLLDRLDAYAEADGTVLDNSIVVWCNELSSGKSHSCRDLPYVLAGSGGGYLRTGRYLKLTRDDDDTLDRSASRNQPYPYIDVADDAPHNKLLTTILNAVGVRADDGGPIESFGVGGYDWPNQGTGLGRTWYDIEPGEFDQLKA